MACYCEQIADAVGMPGGGNGLAAGFDGVGPLNGGKRVRDEAVLLDVADAVASSQAVDWERAGRAARPGQRSVLGSLRALAALFPPGPAAARASPAGVRGEPFAGVFTRYAIGVVLVASLVEIAASLSVLPWTWVAYRRAYGPAAVFLTSILLFYAAAATLVLAAVARRSQGSQRDDRAWLLGVYFAALGSVPSAHLLPFVLWGAAPADGVMHTIYVHPYLFASAILWTFVRNFPAVHRRSRIDATARRMIPVTVLLGVAIEVVFIVWRELVQAGIARLDPFLVFCDAAFATLSVLDAAAVGVLSLRARGAPADEFARVVLFCGGFAMWLGGSALYDVIEVFTPGFFLSNLEEQWTPFVVVVIAARLTGMALMCYAVLARGALDVRIVVRASYRRLLARRALALTAAAPLAGIAALFASRPDRTVAELMAEPWAGVLVAAAGGSLAAIAGRRRVLLRLDAWIYPEAAQQQRLLAGLGPALAKTARAADIGKVVTRFARRGCGSRATLLVGADAADLPHHFTAPHAGAPPLPRSSAIAHVLATNRTPFRIAPGDPMFDLLPDEDVAWVVAASAAAVVPVFGGGGAALRGIVAVGRRVDDRLPSPVDIAFVETMAMVAGIALERVSFEATPAGRGAEAPCARECPACGLVAAAGAAPRCVCGAAWVDASMPSMLAGKFLPERRLGAGGMGTVYLARDVDLNRYVAIKTLASTSPGGTEGTESAPVGGLIRLKQEASVMAALSHPAIAHIHGLETWRGHLFLVVEYLARGTLADRLDRRSVSALPAPEARGVAVTIAGALAAIHEAGWLHRDVKPSNIGFTAAGTVKLLDFGLAALTGDEQPLSGTAPYLSPELLRGGAPTEADDVWALGVVLYEMVTGRHPFAGGGGRRQIADRILRRRIPAPSAVDRAAPAAAVIAFATGFLTAEPAARPPSARAFAEALRALPESDGQASG